MSNATTTSLRVIHIGAFDLASYGDQLYPLIAAHELGRRLPGLELAPFGPLGTSRTGGASTTLDDLADSGPTWALGPWTEQRAEEISRQATLVLCGGGEVVQGDGTVYAPFYGIGRAEAERLAIDRWFLEGLGAAETTCPVVWHGPGVPAAPDPATAQRLHAALGRHKLVTVRDEHSRRLLETAGIEQAIAVVPDSALLLPRVLPADHLAHVRAQLVAAGAFPDNGADRKVMVVQGNHTMTRFLDELAPALEALPADTYVVTVSVSPCHNDHLFAAALRARLTRPTWDVPTSTPLEGVAAAIAGADCFLGVSLHGAITAVAYGRPSVTFDPYHQAKLAAFLDLVELPERRADTAAEAVEQAGQLADAFAENAEAGTAHALADLHDRIDAHFDRVAALAEKAAHERNEPLAPLTWADTGNARHLALRNLPLPPAPLAADDPPALRRPDCAPTQAELAAAVLDATSARSARREADLQEVKEMESLRSQNVDLRGAIAHLEGMTEQLRAEADRARAFRPGAVLRRLRRTFKAGR